MNEAFYKMYKSGRDMVESLRDEKLSEPFNDFIKSIEAGSDSLDKSNPEYFKRWENERFVLFRFHRGCLDESMQTVTTIKSFDHLIKHIETHWDFVPMVIKISPYTYDDRIDWDTHIVSAQFKGIERQGYMPVGFLNRHPNWDVPQGEESEGN